MSKDQEVLPPLPMAVADARSNHDAKGRFAPGNGAGGRTAGSPNNVTTDLRRMIVGALNNVGGESYLTYHAMVNPQLFFPLIGKALPVKAGPDGGEAEAVEYRYIKRIPMKKPNAG